MCVCLCSSQDKRMSLVDYVVSYYLHYVDQVAHTATHHLLGPTQWGG